MKIAYGDSRTARKWKNNEISWEDFCKRVSTTQYTTETVEEYRKMTKARRDAIKDVGGYVAGHLKDGRRKVGHVICRSMLTLDMDNGMPGILDELKMLTDYRMCVYSTHINKNHDGHYKTLYYYSCTNNRKSSGATCSFVRRYNQEKIDGAVYEVVEKLTKFPEFQAAVTKQAHDQATLEQLEDQLKQKHKELRSLELVNRKLGEQLDSLDVLDFIEENLASSLEIEDIAQIAALSPFYYQRIFGALCGMTVGEYIRARRMTVAAQELSSTDYESYIWIPLKKINTVSLR